MRWRYQKHCSTVEQSHVFSPHLRRHFVHVFPVTEMLSMAETSTQTSRLPSTDSAVDPFGMQGRSEYEESCFVPDVQFSPRMPNTKRTETASANLCLQVALVLLGGGLELVTCTSEPWTESPPIVVSRNVVGFLFHLRPIHR